MPDDVFRIVVAVAVAFAAVAFVVQAGVVLALYRGFKESQQKVNQFIGKAEPVMAKAELTIDKIGPVLEKLGPTIDRMRPVIDRLGPVIDKIGPAVDKIGPAVDKIGPVFQKIGPVADKIGIMVDDVTKVIHTSNQILEDTRPQIAEIAAEAAAITKLGREQVDNIGALVKDANVRLQKRLEQIDHAVETTVDQIEHVGDSVKRSVLAPVKGVNGLAAGISAAVSTLVHGSRKSSVDSATQDEEMFI